MCSSFKNQISIGNFVNNFAFKKNQINWTFHRKCSSLLAKRNVKKACDSVGFHGSWWQKKDHSSSSSVLLFWRTTHSAAETKECLKNLQKWPKKSQNTKKKNFFGHAKIWIKSWSAPQKCQYCPLCKQWQEKQKPSSATEHCGTQWEDLCKVRDREREV